MATKENTNVRNVCCMKISISSLFYRNIVEEVIYYRGNVSVLFVERWRWYIEYLAALVKVANPKRTVSVYIGPQEVIVGKEWHEYRRSVLIKSAQKRIKKLEEGVVDDDLFHFKSQDNEQKKEAEYAKIEALEKDEFKFAEFPEQINTIRKWIKKISKI